MGLVTVEHDLDAARFILDVGEGIFTHGAEKDEAARDKNVLGLIAFSVFEMADFFPLGGCNDLGSFAGMGIFGGIGVDAQLADLREFAAAVLKFFVAVVFGFLDHKIDSLFKFWIRCNS